MSYDAIIKRMYKFNHRRIAYKCSIMHLLLPSTVTQRLLIIQASYYRITKLRAHITQKCTKLNIHKCGFLQIRSQIGSLLVFMTVLIIITPLVLEFAVFWTIIWPNKVEFMKQNYLALPYGLILGCRIQ